MSVGNRLHGGISGEQNKTMNNLNWRWRVLAVSTVCIAVLSGCGTSEVKELSPSTYTVSGQFGSLNGSWERAQMEAVAKAKAFCAAKKETYAFISEQRSGVLGFTPQVSNITFSCGPNTTALIQAATSECKEQLQIPELDPIRTKVELYRENWERPAPFAIATIDA